MQSPVVWISLKQKNEFLSFVTDQYKNLKQVDSNRKVTDMSKEICERYLESLQEGINAKDEEIEEVPDKISFIELKDQLPETAKPNLLNYIHRKLDQINKMEIPLSVNEHLEQKHLMSRK